ISTRNSSIEPAPPNRPSPAGAAVVSLLPEGVVRRAVGQHHHRWLRVPKGARIIPNLYGVHHDPLHFPEPDRFQPDRFLRDGRFQPFRHLLPFSLGKRACPGEALARMERPSRCSPPSCAASPVALPDSEAARLDSLLRGSDGFVRRVVEHRSSGFTELAAAPPPPTRRRHSSSSSSRRRSFSSAGDLCGKKAARGLLIDVKPLQHPVLWGGSWEFGRSWSELLSHKKRSRSTWAAMSSHGSGQANRRWQLGGPREAEDEALLRFESEKSRFLCGSWQDSALVCRNFCELKELSEFRLGSA
uniref:Cytochrome P450 n=1 Tax=Macrostomum lignano TaxID=282301 RepID=A0A1I8JR99_9PLAT